MKNLKGFQKKYLRGRAHALKPIVFIGQKGVTDNVVQSTDEALNKHPKSGRAFFELGQIYQARGDVEKAMLTYYQALSLVYSREMKNSNRK